MRTWKILKYHNLTSRTENKMLSSKRFWTELKAEGNLQSNAMLCIMLSIVVEYLIILVDLLVLLSWRKVQLIYQYLFTFLDERLSKILLIKIDNSLPLSVVQMLQLPCKPMRVQFFCRGTASTQALQDETFKPRNLAGWVWPVIWT